MHEINFVKTAEIWQLYFSETDIFSSIEWAGVDKKMYVVRFFTVSWDFPFLIVNCFLEGGIRSYYMRGMISSNRPRSTPDKVRTFLNKNKWRQCITLFFWEYGIANLFTFVYLRLFYCINNMCFNVVIPLK